VRPTARRHDDTARGTSVLEAIVALLLGVLLMGLILSVLARQREVVASLGRRAEVLATLRTVRVVLRTEARAGSGAWRTFQDSLALRGFRGAGTACSAGDGEAAVRVAPWGIRAPDPSKDSVMVVTARGEVFFRGLLRTEGGGGSCGPGDPEDRERWVLTGPVPEAVLVRYFEHGSYHLSAGALRYRRGGSGRQPLTPEVLVTPESRFLSSGAGLRALLFFRRPARATEVFVGRGGA